MAITFVYPSTCTSLAPCGRTVEAYELADDDDFGMIIRSYRYTCGCRTVRREYHDGSVSERTVRHNGKKITSKLRPEQGC